METTFARDTRTGVNSELLNDTEHTLNGFQLNGLTTTLGVGYSF